MTRLFKWIKHIILAIVIILTLGYVVIMWENQTGFILNDEQSSNAHTASTGQLSPLSNGYIFPRPDITIPDAENATVIVYMHGTNNSYMPENCSIYYNKPPSSIMALTQIPNTHIYNVCAKSTDGFIDGTPLFPTDGQWIHRRVDLLEKTLNQMINAGVNPSRLFLAGHSAGGWASLTAAKLQGEKFNSIIAFSPACCGSRKRAKKNPYWRTTVRNSLVNTIIRTDSINALIFAYTDDSHNRPQELNFLNPYAGIKIIPQFCDQSHITYRNDCNEIKTIAIMKNYIKTRITEYQK